MARDDDPPLWIQQHRWDTGRRLRALRVDRGWTQIQLAERCEIDNKTISRVENGRVAMSIDQVARLARALNVPSWRLFRE